MCAIRVRILFFQQLASPWLFLWHTSGTCKWRWMLCTIWSFGLILIRALPPGSQPFHTHLSTSSSVISISEPGKINYCMFLFHERVRLKWWMACNIRGLKAQSDERHTCFTSPWCLHVSTWTRTRSPGPPISGFIFDINLLGGREGGRGVGGLVTMSLHSGAGA